MASNLTVILADEVYAVMQDEYSKAHDAIDEKKLTPEQAWHTAFLRASFRLGMQVGTAMREKRDGK